MNTEVKVHPLLSPATTASGAAPRTNPEDGTVPQGPAPLVSIGLNCFKAERWIGECLDSILAQTIQDFEIVISDNASPDRTVAVCEEYAARDPRIRIHRYDRNVGVARNTNKVFELSRGEYFCWASANDCYAPDFLERCLAPMQADGAIDLVAPQIATFEVDRNHAEPDPKHFAGTSESSLDRIIGLLTSVRDGRLFRGLYRRTALVTTMPLSTRFGHDITLVARIAARGKVVTIGGDPLFFIRCAPGTATHTIPAHLRVKHYEPEDGLKTYILHRTINQIELWKIALSAAKTVPARLHAAVRMLRVSYRWKSEIYFDIYDIAGLIRGYLKSIVQRG